MEFLIIFAFLLAIGSNADDSASKCKDTQHWDPLLKVCRECDWGMIYNKTSRQCVDRSQADKSCSKGYKFDMDERKCIDIDECNQKVDPCQKNQYCRNLAGTFICVNKQYCGQGWEYKTDTETCKDIDECKQNLHNCGDEEVCVNVPGSFTCRPPCPPNKKFYWNSVCHICTEGHRFNQTLNQCEDVDECVGPYKLQCQPYREICVKKPGLSECVTHCSGGTLNINGQCVDTDECADNIHNCTSNERCSNFFGGFTCEEIRCNNNEILNKQTKECHCKPGYKHYSPYSSRCEDIDECEDTVGVCGIHGTCKNKIGGHECNCYEGYEERNGICQDIDECKVMAGVCGHLKCENEPGKFKCVCPKGFRKTLENICEDVNECVDKPGICLSDSLQFHHKCYNLIGSFKCIKSQCPADYRQIKGSENANICQLVDPKCSEAKVEGCIQQLPEKIVFRVIQIQNSPTTSYNIGTIEMEDLNFDHYHAKVNVQKSVHNRTTELDISNAIMLTRSQDEKKLFIHIVKALPDDSEIVIDIHIKSNYDSKEKSYAFYEFHVFVTNPNIEYEY